MIIPSSFSDNRSESFYYASAMVNDDSQDPQSDQSGDNASDELQELKAQLAKLKDTAARAQADLLNFKDRMKREGEELRKFAALPFILELLPVRDDLVRAAGHDSASGLKQILLKIDALGKKMDPERHQIVNTGAGEKDIVTLVHEEGFLLHGKVLRPAKVQVGDGN